MEVVLKDFYILFLSLKYCGSEQVLTWIIYIYPFYLSRLLSIVFLSVVWKQSYPCSQLCFLTISFKPAFLSSFLFLGQCLVHYTIVCNKILLLLYMLTPIKTPWLKLSSRHSDEYNTNNTHIRVWNILSWMSNQHFRVDENEEHNVSQKLRFRNRETQGKNLTLHTEWLRIALPPSFPSN